MSDNTNKILLLVVLDENSMGHTEQFDQLYQMGHELLFLSDGIRNIDLVLIKEQMIQKSHDMNILRHGCKLGKAESIYSAICYAEKLGFEYVVTVKIEENFNLSHIEYFTKRLLEANLDTNKDAIFVLEHDGDQYIAQHKIPSFANHLMKSISGSQYADLVSSVRAYPISCKKIVRAISTLDFDFEILLRANTIGILIVPFVVHADSQKNVVGVNKSVFRFIKFFFFLFLFKATRPIKQLLRKTV